MTIGLSHSAARLLAQLVQARHRGVQSGLAEDQLWFRLSKRQEQTTIEFAAADPPLHTSDRNAIAVLRANGFIERFTTIAAASRTDRYVVTQAGIRSIERILP
jgi:hypothetical protein